MSVAIVGVELERVFEVETRLYGEMLQSQMRWQLTLEKSSKHPKELASILPLLLLSQVS
jgi:hypothetical protein